ncbi:phospholipid/cholesterol/gamma-HCH transport system permease protein [Haloechinothrix alba]|uniref:Phospholipid/cholesterol/gamma-HCH transport system permease protein n=1 Tax=Haloechinothrix alba TaxID=664784 RepID=A0A238Y548_9PSEU|nr:ABC transporter permease [Haloechinothrix alba]SNR65911.1 phospholipid/cholesterol/gamma-HCH transport system permease protein [Haloechinothrix alba]
MTTVSDRSADSRDARPATEGAQQGYLEEIALVTSWTARTIVELPKALRFPTEIIRQCAIMILSSSVVVWMLVFTGGVMVAEVSHYFLETIGAQAYIGFVTAAATLKGTSCVFFGYIIAAKVGCGIVAELGAMRINEEIDAMEVMGVPSRTFLVGTRVWASVIAFPFLFVTGFSWAFVGSYVTNVIILKTVSVGGYNSVFWAFTTPGDMFIRSMLWAMITALLAIIIACYYGYTASGGPVGVGENTARSMAFNFVMVNLLGAGAMFQLFYGTNVVIPIGN